MSELQITRVVAEPVGDRATEYTIPMRDGVGLAADLYLPPGVAQAPTILVRLPYDKNSRYVFFDKVAERFTDRGYAVVVQDVRGKFRSEGPTEAFEHEVNDGYDTIDWIVGQEWSDGAVGMFGDSYYAFTQWAAVVSGHPALKAIVPRVMTFDMAVVNGGLGGFGEPVPWLEGAFYLASYWVDREAYEYVPDYAKRPLTTVFEEAFAAIGARSHAFDARYPVPVDPKDPFGAKHPRDAAPVPVMQTVGWYDNLVVPHMRDVMELESIPGWAAVQYLEAGAFDHENYLLDLAPVGEADDHGVNDEALSRMLDIYTGHALDFLDVYVREIQAPASLPKVRWELGHVGWRTADQWPPAGATSRTFGLADVSAATGAVPGGRIAEPREAGAEGEVSWVYDPDDLVPSAVENSFAFLFDYPDERETGDREDVLVFTGAPVDAPLDLAGPVQLEATVSSTAPSADVFAKLLDVAPDGSARMIVRGQVHVADARRRSRIRIDLGHTGYRVRAGHALRLHLASSDFPLFVPNSGTEENPWTATNPRTSRQTLHASADAPAHLILTVLDEEA